MLVTGKPGQTTLPAPFDQVPIPPGHEIHDKFVVCGINGKDPVVWCGSSNLASGGVDFRDIGNIFITHPHSDHTGGLGALMTWLYDRGDPRKVATKVSAGSS